MVHKEPYVSICSITYNHAPFIRQCLDSFLMQQTDFPFEIIINDDCSTDGTTEIIREYEEKYPDKIFPIYHEKNLNIVDPFQKFVFPKARGKYIALCEGDDYWTDPLKLQKQVDFLESHPDYSMCFHKAKVIVQDGREYIDYFSKLEEREYKPNEILSQWLIPTASIVMRKSVQVPTHKDFRTSDVVIHAACVASGKVYCMSEEMSAYRLHGTGWSNHNITEAEFRIITIPHRLALMECFPGIITNDMRKWVSKCCIMWLASSKFRGRISSKYFFKTLLYAKFELLSDLLAVLLYKIKCKIGIDSDPPV